MPSAQKQSHMACQVRLIPQPDRELTSDNSCSSFAECRAYGGENGQEGNFSQSAEGADGGGMDDDDGEPHVEEME